MPPCDDQLAWPHTGGDLDTRAVGQAGRHRALLGVLSGGHEDKRPPAAMDERLRAHEDDSGALVRIDIDCNRRVDGDRGRLDKHQAYQGGISGAAAFWRRGHAQRDGLPVDGAGDARGRARQYAGGVGRRDGGRHFEAPGVDQPEHWVARRRLNQVAGLVQPLDDDAVKRRTDDGARSGRIGRGQRASGARQVRLRVRHVAIRALEIAAWQEATLHELPCARPGGACVLRLCHGALDIGLGARQRPGGERDLEPDEHLAACDRFAHGPGDLEHARRFRRDDEEFGTRRRRHHPARVYDRPDASDLDRLDPNGHDRGLFGLSVRRHGAPAPAGDDRHGGNRGGDWQGTGSEDRAGDTRAVHVPGLDIERVAVGHRRYDKRPGVPSPWVLPMPDYNLTDAVVLPFILIPVVLVVLLLWGTDRAGRRLAEPAAVRRRAVFRAGVVAALWMAVTWEAAAAGVLRQWEAVPPPLLVLLAAIAVLALRVSLGPAGTRLARGLPLWALVAVQGFRLPLELAMHGLAERGIMPAQMTYTGRNFDIVTGATALFVAGAVYRGGWHRLAAAWNVMGALLLLNIIVVAVASTPVFRAFGDDRLNVFVTYPPFVWLPAVMVLAAMAGHVLVLRALRIGHDRQRAAADPPVPVGSDGDGGSRYDAIVSATGANRFPVQRSEEQWRQLLTPEQYAVLREHATERPGSCALLAEKRPGTFSCAGCGQPLFASDRKFESGTGWPSFFAPLEGAVGTTVDRSYGMVRTEVHCSRCGGHLGHVFPDGPPPTGERYCINGVALTFEPRG